jgi:hypothetical protein
MKGNPEFARNLWLEITPQRMLIMPMVLGALFLLAFVSDKYSFADSVATTAIMAYLALALLWGTKQASESVMNEIRDHTWDSQRMSSISPMDLAIGKLFGSTIYSWYGALICLTVYALSVQPKKSGDPLMMVLVFLLGGIFAQSVGMLASMMAIRKDRKLTRGQTAGFLILGVVVTLPFFGVVVESHLPVEWYGVTFDWTPFLISSLFCFTFWAIAGIYQLMRVELQVRNMPWLWYGFVIFLMVYAAGFTMTAKVANESTLGAAPPPLFAAFFVALATTYFMAFAERKDFILISVLMGQVRNKEWRTFLERSPRWILTLPLAMIAGVILALSGSGDLGARVKLLAMVASLLFFTFRDLGVMLFCNLGGSTKRADMLTVLYLSLLYGIVPTIFEVMGFKSATLLFWPRIDLYPFLGAALALLEAIAMACLVKRRWLMRQQAANAVS